MPYLHHTTVNLYCSSYDYGFCREIAFITGVDVGAIQTNQGWFFFLGIHSLLKHRYNDIIIICLTNVRVISDFLFSGYTILSTKIRFYH